MEEETIKELREKAEVPIAEMAYTLGVSVRTYQHWEQGTLKNRPRKTEEKFIRAYLKKALKKRGEK